MQGMELDPKVLELLQTLVEETTRTRQTLEALGEVLDAAGKMPASLQCIRDKDAQARAHLKAEERRENLLTSQMASCDYDQPEIRLAHFQDYLVEHPEFGPIRPDDFTTYQLS